MSKRHTPQPINFEDFLDKKVREGRRPIIVGDKTFHLRPLAAFSNDEFRTFRTSTDPFVDADILLEEPLDEFMEAGGTVAGLTALVQAIAEGEQGVTLGESAASSDS